MERLHKDILFFELNDLDAGLASLVGMPKERINKIKEVAADVIKKYKDKLVSNTYVCWLKVRGNDIYMDIKERLGIFGCAYCNTPSSSTIETVRV